jgi:hypothetical protein
MRITSKRNSYVWKSQQGFYETAGVVKAFVVVFAFVFSLAWIIHEGIATGRLFGGIV